MSAPDGRARAAPSPVRCRGRRAAATACRIWCAGRNGACSGIDASAQASHSVPLPMSSSRGSSWFNGWWSKESCALPSVAARSRAKASSSSSSTIEIARTSSRAMAWRMRRCSSTSARCSTSRRSSAVGAKASGPLGEMWCRSPAVAAWPSRARTSAEIVVACGLGRHRCGPSGRQEQRPAAAVQPARGLQVEGQHRPGVHTVEQGGVHGLLTAAGVAADPSRPWRSAHPAGGAQAGQRQQAEASAMARQGSSSAAGATEAVAASAEGTSTSETRSLVRPGMALVTRRRICGCTVSMFDCA